MSPSENVYGEGVSRSRTKNVFEMSNETDINELARKARGGNVHAFEKLARELTPVLMGFFRKKAGADAEELTQQTWFRVASKFQQYDTSRDFKSWIFGIAYYEWVNAQRLHARNPLPLVSDPDGTSEEQERSVEGLILKLEECLKKLCADERSIIYMRYWEDLSLEVVAARMETPYGRLKGMAHRAVVKLRKCMQDKT